MTQTQKNMPEPRSLAWARCLLGPDTHFDAFRPFRDKQLEDTARLIAAAPELLTALKALVDWNGKPGSHPPALWQRARAAIAKAEGR